METMSDIPKPLYFESKNTYSGSIGLFCYKVIPSGEELTASVWKGPYCLEKSEALSTKPFPLTAQGREALLTWLAEQHAAFLESVQEG